jgi:hypothetical protein
MIKMKTSLTGLAVAALLVAGSSLSSTLPGFAEDAPTPQTPAAAAPATPPAAQADAPSGAAHYRHHRYGYYRTAYWEPFPIMWPHFYHNRVHWNRIPWFVRF